MKFIDCNIFRKSINRIASLFSFGDGRSGTFIALDHLLEISKNAIDVVKFINDMGNDSSVTMQTPVSWMFVMKFLC